MDNRSFQLAQTIQLKETSSLVEAPKVNPLYARMPQIFKREEAALPTNEQMMLHQAYNTE